MGGCGALESQWDEGRMGVGMGLAEEAEVASPEGPHPPVFCASFTVVVQSLSHVQLFAAPWTAARHTSLSFSVSVGLLKLVCIESMPSNHLILCHPLLLPSIFPSIRVFSVSLLFASGGQTIGASTSVLPVNIQG